MTSELKDDERIKAGVARLLAQRNTYAALVKQRDHEETIAEALRILGAKKGRDAAIKWVSDVASIGDIKRFMKLPLKAEITNLRVGEENSSPVDAFCDAFFDTLTEIYELIPEDEQ